MKLKILDMHPNDLGKIDTAWDLDIDDFKYEPHKKLLIIYVPSSNYQIFQTWNEQIVKDGTFANNQLYAKKGIFIREKDSNETLMFTDCLPSIIPSPINNTLKIEITFSTVSKK
ncbi:hypothetical protein [Leptospira bouyouniensis]|uniref:Uncharacterized protein n=1 Tax=Leptospira bouyouniensis TaxID=2484911 RepID=A0A7I0IHP9_9LEPT|nr:hypothetical protein [Leptospira bouyouniensis]TGL02177.1 hypothetical protein EHQ43_17615 [Leptospira bouyouniensis]TGM88705.1 hypothetical protein EHQ99_00055 [Leptospira bouyouniensis]